MGSEDDDHTACHPNKGCLLHSPQHRHSWASRGVRQRTSQMKKIYLQSISVSVHAFAFICSSFMTFWIKNPAFLITEEKPWYLKALFFFKLGSWVISSVQSFPNCYMCPIYSPLLAYTHTHAGTHMHMLFYILLYSYLHNANNTNITVCTVYTYIYPYMYMYMSEHLSWRKSYSMLPGRESSSWVLIPGSPDLSLEKDT